MTQNPTYDDLLERIRRLEKKIHMKRCALDALKQEQLFSEKVLDSLPGIFYLYDEQGNLIRWNKNHELLTGFDADELPKRGMLDWFSANEREVIAAKVTEVFTTGKADSEAHLLVKSGEAVPYFFTGLRMTVGGKKYLLGMGIDLSKQKKTEAELRASEEKYRAIFANAVEGIYQTTPDGRFASANPAMARLLGYDSPQELMATVRDIKKQLYASEKERDDFIRIIGSGRKVSGFEVQFYRKDGSLIWASLYARPVLNENGDLVLIEGLMADITEQKRRTDALKEREEYLRKENIRLRSNIKDRYRFGDIVGKSPPMQDVYEMILKAAATDANVIIYGESGTGKELVARAIHQLSDRKQKRFVPVNCAAIPENLLESEFFGYKKGAFTGAGDDKPGYLDLADGGVLFLDELGEIGPNLQVKLLRVLEGGGYTPVGGLDVIKPDLRIIAATNSNLEDYVTQGVMREDFFYRVHIIPIHLPPLRDRKEDIPLLIEHFMQSSSSGNEPLAVTGEMMAAMIQYDWPGNVRELQNVLQRFRTLKRFDLSKKIPTVAAQQHPATPPEGGDHIQGETFQEAMDRVEKRLLLRALEANRWHREATAKSMGLAPRTFFRKIKRHGLIRHK